jgi:uncharacterized protein (TIGR02448 family)
MKSLILAVLVLASSGAQAFFITTTPMSLPVSTTDATSGSDKKMMVIIDAKDDAAAFVASEGQIQGSFLTRAFEQIRNDNPSWTASDAELANAIINFRN